MTDDKRRIRAVVRKWIADPTIDAVITTGGTGFTGRDVTPEAVEPLFEKRMEGFSAVFHRISYDKIGTSTIQSRATAGLANGTFIFCLPGSPGACKDAWDGILVAAVRLSPAAVQLRRDHAAPRRTPEADETAEARVSARCFSASHADLATRRAVAPPLMTASSRPTGPAGKRPARNIADSPLSPSADHRAVDEGQRIGLPVGRQRLRRR